MNHVQHNLIKIKPNFMLQVSRPKREIMPKSNSIQLNQIKHKFNIPKWFASHPMNKKSKSKTTLGFKFSAITSKLGKNVPNTFSSNWSNQSSIKQHLSILIHPISLKMLKIKFSQIKVLANKKKIGENQSN